MEEYNNTLQYLYERLPMYQRVGSIAIKKDLSNIRLLLERMNLLPIPFPSIHVAGTNGKGTTSHLLSAIFSSYGYQTGLYTSPHYVDFRERIKIDGAYVPKDYVVEFVNTHQKLIEEIIPSFFEITVAMAFAYFHSSNVDMAIIETGLGGRLDSTNIIDPVLSVITNISLDHTEMLGPDEYTIAGEKAGIIKPGRPVVVGRFQPSCDHVFLNKAKVNQSEISFASLQWHHVATQKNDLTFSRRKTNQTYKIRLSEVSPFIVENITTALEAMYQYNRYSKIKIGAGDIVQGINSFKELSNYSGRWQILGNDPIVIADSAHNFQAIESVLEHIKKLHHVRIHFVLGFVKEKDIRKILKLFDPQHSYYFTSPSIPRGLPVEELLNTADSLGLKGTPFPSVEEAFKNAKMKATADEMIFVGGSSFIVADMLSLEQK